MPRRTEIVAEDAPRGSGAYSQAVRAGDFVFISGQGPLDPHTLQVRGATIQEQTEITIRNVRAIAEAAGGTLDDVVKVSAFLASIDDFAAFDETYARVLDVRPRPARTTVACELKGIKVEIDAVLYVPL
jgi:2-iminobutanoate/2-iminopropanoate deaminase